MKKADLVNALSTEMNTAKHIADEIPAKKSVKFKATKTLTDAVNE